MTSVLERRLFFPGYASKTWPEWVTCVETYECYAIRDGTAHTRCGRKQRLGATEKTKRKFNDSKSIYCPLCERKTNHLKVAEETVR